MFNALKYSKSLEESGFAREQAEILVRMFMQMIEFNMVSKSDFDKFQTEVFHQFDKVDDKLNKLSLYLTIKMGVMLAVSVGLLSTILAIKL